MNKKLILGFSIIVILGIVFAVGCTPTSQPAFDTSDDLKLVVFKENGIIRYIDNSQAKISDSNGEENLYISTELLKNEFGIYESYDIKNNILVITTRDKVIRFYGNDDKVKVNQEENKNIPPMIVEDGKPLISLNYIEEDLNLATKYYKKDNSIFIKSIETDETVANIARDNTKVRSKKSIWADYLEILQLGDEVRILEKDNLWVKILTPRGQEGYIALNEIENEKEIEGIETEVSGPIWKPKNKKIVLTWEHVHSRNPDTSNINEMKGVNVISPTWISLSNSAGKIRNNIDRDYIEWAHNREYKVWALFSNSFEPKLTDEFLGDSVAREKTINDLLKLIKDNNIDGVNIDFENVYLRNKEELVQFVRELVPVFHENNIVVSIDVTVRGGSEMWSQFLDREELGKVVDYIAVMTYDEHWRSSPKSGSVASLGWVKRGVEGLLEQVPEEKLLLGLPFYTRLWIEIPSQTEVEGMNVKSKVLWMEDVNEIMKKDNVVRIWDDSAGQYYLAYIEDNKLHKIWVEDAKSIALKTDLVHQYDLAGVAAWRRGFETEDIWQAIYDTLNNDDK